MSTAASLPEAVAEVILRQYESLPKTGKPQPNEHTVLAGFAVSINDDIQGSGQGAAIQPGDARLVPVALGTGTKCVGSRQSRDQIDVINDSHAEVSMQYSTTLVYLTIAGPCAFCVHHPCLKLHWPYPEHTGNPAASCNAGAVSLRISVLRR